MLGIRELQPPMLKTSMVGLLGGDVGNRERPPPMSKTSLAVPLGDDDGDLGAPTTHVKDVDGGPPGR
jgi:hypothetical protein